MWWLPILITSLNYNTINLTQGPEAAEQYLIFVLTGYLVLFAFLVLIGVICCIYDAIAHKPLTPYDLTGDKYYCGGIALDPKTKRLL